MVRLWQSLTMPPTLVAVSAALLGAASSHTDINKPYAVLVPHRMCAGQHTFCKGPFAAAVFSARFAVDLVDRSVQLHQRSVLLDLCLRRVTSIGQHTLLKSSVKRLGRHDVSEGRGNAHQAAARV